MALVCGPPHLHTCACPHCEGARARRQQRALARAAAEAQRLLNAEAARHAAGARLVEAALARGVPCWTMKPWS